VQEFFAKLLTTTGRLESNLKKAKDLVSKTSDFSGKPTDIQKNRFSKYLVLDGKAASVKEISASVSKSIDSFIGGILALVAAALLLLRLHGVSLRWLPATAVFRAGLQLAVISVLLLLLGVTAVLSPSAIGIPAGRRDVRVRLVIAQIISLVLGALLGVLVLDLPWWQTPPAERPAPPRGAAARRAPRRRRAPHGKRYEDLR